MRRRREFIVLIMVNKADRERDNCWGLLTFYIQKKRPQFPVLRSFIYLFIYFLLLLVLW